MIVFEKPESFVMIQQSDHAQLSGQVAEQWHKETPGGEWWSDAIYAIYQHDASWVGLDAVPFWNDKRQRPYTFHDFPVIPKLAFYKLGLDETEKNNAYAALLCSMHYTSFLQDSSRDADKKFLIEEHERQARLKHICGVCFEPQQVLLQYYFRLLQFCDDVSLYVCLNEPGCAKEEEHPWFREGFQSSRYLMETPAQQIVAHWQGAAQIVLEPFPFQQTFSTQLRLKEVSKRQISTLGVADAYAEAPDQTRVVRMVGRNH